MAPHDRSKFIQSRVSHEELAMIAALADAKRLSQSELMRSLIREAYEERFGKKQVPRQVQVRGVIDMLALEADAYGRPDIRVQLTRCQLRQKAFDKNHPDAKGLALGAEEDALRALEKFARVHKSKALGKSAGDAALDALRELESFYYR